MPGALFVIASSVDHKLINRLLLHLRDWEYGEEPTWDNFHLLTSKILPEKTDNDCATSPPISENGLSNNEWKGKTIADVESFMLNGENTKSALNSNTFIILDEEGVKDGTVVLLNLMDGDEDDEGEVDKFNKVRVPWEKAYIIWCNLDIANMNFEDFVEDEDGDDVEWWTYRDLDDGQETDESKSSREKRNIAIAELEQNGMA